MARNPKTATVKFSSAEKALIRQGRGENAAAVDVPTVTVADGPILSFGFGRRGRPDAATVAAIGAAFDILASLVARMPDPKPTALPRKATPRVRAAFAADDAAVLAAHALIRTAVANGRARSNGR